MIRHVLAALVAGSLAVVPATADDDAAPDPSGAPVAGVGVGPGAAGRVAPTAVSPECARTVLRYGSRGYCVTELQLNLNILFGLGLAMDGSYGPATTSAVYWFQKRYGLTYDGITGPQTWSKIAWCLSRARAGLPY